MLPAAQAGPREARDASGDTGRSLGRLTGDGLLREVEHGVHRASKLDGASWRGRSRTTYLGHVSAVPTPDGPSGMVARLLSLCASSPITTSGARAATRARWQTSGTTLSPADPSDGSGENQPTMDGSGGTLVSLAACLRLRGIEARQGAVSCRVEMSEGTSSSTWMKAHSGKERPV